MKIPKIDPIGKQYKATQENTTKDNLYTMLLLTASGVGLASLGLLTESNEFIPPGNINHTVSVNPSIQKTPLVSIDSLRIPRININNEDDYSIGNRLRALRSFEERERFLNETLNQLNPELLQSNDSALSEFNTRNNLSLICLGVKQSPYEFVFIDNNYFLGKSQDPVRIGLSLDEVKNTRSKSEVVSLLERKLAQHKEELKEQYLTWARPHQYDFPRQNGAAMVALALSNLSGMESDLARAVEMYDRQYGMAIEAMCVDASHIPQLKREFEEIGITRLPNITPATRSSILTQLELSLKKAIDDGKESFMFHYMTHGGSTGNIVASDQTFRGDDIAQVLAINYRGRPICDQIDITVWAGSCYSGRQLDDIKKYFADRSHIPVKSLRVFAESTYTTAGAGTTPENASLVSDLMRDKSGPIDYYNSWYREYINYLHNKKNIPLENLANTYIHRMKFGDMMVRFDTFNKQDPQGYYYTNAITSFGGNISEGRYFTNYNPNNITTSSETPSRSNNSSFNMTTASLNLRRKYLEKIINLKT